MTGPRPELRVALLGQGFMGKAHSNALAQVGRFFEVPYRLRLAVLCGRDESKLTQSAEVWGWEETATDWKQVVERPDIDVVDVALPNHLHAEASIRAAKAGKIVWCEKPLANTLADAQLMVEAARNVPTMVWFNYRRVPAIAFARNLIEQDKLGEIFHYRATYQQQWGPDRTRPVNWKMNPQEAGHGVVGDLLSHVVDTALFLNGEIQEVTAFTRIFAAGRTVEDAAAALVKFRNGSAGTFESTRFGTGALNQNLFQIQGEKGMLRFNLEDLNRLEFYDATDPAPLRAVRSLLVTDPAHPYGKNFWKPGHIVGYEHTFIAALADFLLSLANRTTFHPDFPDGLRVQQVLEAALKSAASRQWERIAT